MDTNTLISKTYAKEVVCDYEEILGNVDSIIKQTGYKGRFIAKKLGLPESSFYQKKRKRAFTVKEMQQLVNLMDEENDDIEDAYYAKLLDERKNEPVISLEEFMSRINAKRQKT